MNVVQRSLYVLSVEPCVQVHASDNWRKVLARD